MIEGAMARGELSPGNYTYDWVWIPKIRNSQRVPVRSVGVKNKFINIGMKVGVSCTLWAENSVSTRVKGLSRRRVVTQIAELKNYTGNFQ